MVEFVFNILVFIINTVIWLFGKVLNIIFGFLPNSPFIAISRSMEFSIGKYMGYLSWLIPIKSILSVLVAWLGCMLLYYLYSVVMRWIKLID